MLLVRDETPRAVGQVRTTNIAAFDQPDEAFMIRILEPAAMAQSNWCSTTLIGRRGFEARIGKRIAAIEFS